MKILHVAAGLQETCGVSCFVVEAARAQMAMGHEVRVVTTMTCGYPLRGVPVELLDDPTKTAFRPDIVHIHSTWNLYVHKMARYCRRQRIPYVISPHGALTPWALKFHWWKKIPALLLYQYHDFRCAAAFHVTVPEEAQDIRRLKLHQKVTVAPLGVEPSEFHNCISRRNDFLFLSRIHPKKGLRMLLEAFAEIPESQRNTWRVVIAGPDDVGHQQELKASAESLALQVEDFSGSLQFGKKEIHGGGEVPAEVYREKLAACHADVVFTGPVYSAAKAFLYRSAKYFVLPSFSENFGMVVLEALAAGTPVITTTGTPWSQLPEHGCGWWIAPEQTALRKTLREAMELSDAAWREKSGHAERFIRENFSWRLTAQKLLDLYQGHCPADQSL